MANLRTEEFSEDFQTVAPKECSVYLSACLTKEDEAKMREDWNKAGGFKEIPWWKWCMEHITVSYDSPERELITEEPEENEMERG